MVVSQWEREATVERTRDGLRHKIKSGTGRAGSLRTGDQPRRSPPLKKSDRPNGLMPCPSELESIALMKTTFGRRQVAPGHRRRIDPASASRPGRGRDKRRQHTSVRKTPLGPNDGKIDGEEDRRAKIRHTVSGQVARRDRIAGPNPNAHQIAVRSGPPCDSEVAYPTPDERQPPQTPSQSRPPFVVMRRKHSRHQADGSDHR